jgi:hypothetical protein
MTDALSLCHMLHILLTTTLQGHATILLGLQSTLQSLLLALLLAAFLGCILLLKVRDRLPSCSSAIPSLENLRRRKYAERKHSLSEGVPIVDEEEDVLEDAIEDAPPIDLGEVDALLAEAPTPSIHIIGEIRSAALAHDSLSLTPIASSTPTDPPLPSLAEVAVRAPPHRLAPLAAEMHSAVRTPDSPTSPPIGQKLLLAESATMFTRSQIALPIPKRLSVASAAIRLDALEGDEHIQPHDSLMQNKKVAEQPSTIAPVAR